MEQIRPTTAELDQAHSSKPFPPDMIKCAFIPITQPCRECGCPVYIAAHYWTLGSFAPTSFFVCDHGPKNPKWRVQWDDLTPDQQSDLTRTSVTAAIRVRAWSTSKEA